MRRAAWLGLIVLAACSDLPTQPDTAPLQVLTPSIIDGARTFEVYRARVLGQPSGAYQSEALAINDLGQVLVRVQNSALYYLWQADTGFQYLQVLTNGLPDHDVKIAGMDNRGRVVGVTGAYSPTPLGFTFDIPTGKFSTAQGFRALGFNQAGLVVGSLWTGTATAPATWLPGSDPEVLPMPGWAEACRAEDVNEHGLIVGYCTYPRSTASEGIRWTADGWEELPSADYSRALAVNDAGWVAGSTGSARYGALWQGATGPIPLAGGMSTAVFGVTESGIVGAWDMYREGNTYYGRSYFWVEGQVLRVLGDRNTGDAVDMNASGLLLGTAYVEGVGYSAVVWGVREVVNRPPAFLHSLPDISLIEGGRYLTYAQATDPDGDALSLSLDGPSFCALTDNGGGRGTLDCRPGYYAAGTYEVTLTVTEDTDQQLTDQITFTLTITRAPARVIVAHLHTDVQHLVAAGVLSDGNGNALLSKLEAALASFGKGNHNAAANQVEAFINQVEALVQSGRLSSADAEALLHVARAVLDHM